MRPSTRTILAATLAAGLVAAVLPQPASAFDAAGQKCRSTIAKGGLKNTKAYMKAMTGCFKSRDAAASSTDCNDITAADSAGKIPGTETKFAESIAKSCTAGTPADLLFIACPAPCTAGTPTITTFADVAECLVCLGRDSAEALGTEAFGLPTSPIANAAELSCHSAITKNVSKFYNTILKNVSKCQSTEEKTGTSTVTDCTETQFQSLVWDAYVKTRDAVAKACATVTLPSATLDACGAATSVDELAGCVSESAWDEGQTIITQYLDLPALPLPTTTTTTTTLPTAAGCPNLGELVLYSKLSNTTCTTNADCTDPRTCDTTLGLCTTVATLDSGWKGYALGSDIDDGVRTRAALQCDGPGPVCGDCNVTGLDPEPGNCRCANNSRQVCGDPFAATSDDCPSCSGGPFDGLACSADADCSAQGTCGRRCNNDVNTLCTSDADCPGGTCPAQTKCADGSTWGNSRSCDGTCSGTCTGISACECFFGAPFPLVSGGVAVCVVNRFAEDISGTANVDAGSGEISASLRSRVYTSTDRTLPCPVCDGDAVMDDGIRSGTCVGGANAGQSCDATATNASFPAEYGPAVGGGQYSLDCQPSNGANVTGTGLSVVLNQTTGSVSMGSTVDCNGSDAGSALCPCLVCSKDDTVACHGNADCAGQGGSCTLALSVDCNTNTDCATANVGTCTANGNTRCSLMNTKTCTSNGDCASVPAGQCRISSCSANGTGDWAQPNACTGGICNDLGGGEKGECATGPDDLYCDGLVKADGSGIVTCANDTECSATALGTDAGTCTLLERRKCFLNPIIATGAPDPEFPVAVAAFCVPPTSNSGVNSAAGLPGPARVVSQGAGTTFCASDHNQAYDPGVGGCPP